MNAQPAGNEPIPWVPDISQFSSRLAAIRHAMGWNAKEAALACGVAVQSWREWEAGRQPRDFEGSCDKIVARTGCDLIWLKSGFIRPGVPQLLPRRSTRDHVSGRSSVQSRQGARHLRVVQS